MDSGYVLDFSNQTFEEFIRENFNVNIYDEKYAHYGNSKAKRLQAFWMIDSNEIVGESILKMLEYWQEMQQLNETIISDDKKNLAIKCKQIALRLLDREEEHTINEIDNFLSQKYEDDNIDKLEIESELLKVIKQRIDEVQRLFNAQTPLAITFLSGSILEGILLSIISKHPKQFNQAKSSPKDNKTQKVRPFDEWTLGDMIDTAYELGLLGLDSKDFSNTLRKFRNYIHPNEQMRSRFEPNMKTAALCWQVVLSAIDNLKQNIKKIENSNESI